MDAGTRIQAIWIRNGLHGWDHTSPSPSQRNHLGFRERHLRVSDLCPNVALPWWIDVSRSMETLAGTNPATFLNAGIAYREIGSAASGKRSNRDFSSPAVRSTGFRLSIAHRIRYFSGLSIDDHLDG